MSETGELWLVYVDNTPVADYENPSWQLIGGQKGVDLDRSLDTADITTKQSAGWEEVLPTIRHHELSLDNLFEADDSGLAVLEGMFVNRTKRPIKIDNGTLSFKCWAYCTAYPLSAPLDDAVSTTITLKPSGVVERTPALA